MDTIEEKFSFWCPLQKSEDLIDPTTGDPIYRLGGIASTADEDADGEFLDPKGFDIEPLLRNGLVNWHHQAKGQPATIIGEPTKAEIRPEGLYIETDLYPSSQIARDVWELANTLEKDSKTRRLGYSIEGKVISRKSNDKKSPDYKHITKAVITGVAITHMPKNPKTFANIIKGDIDDDFSGETEQTEEMTPNSEVKRALMKGEILERLFQDIPGISISKANEIYIMLNKFVNMKGKTQITDDDLLKAYEALGLNIEEADVQKGGCAKGGAETEEDEELNKGKGEVAEDDADEGGSDEGDEGDDEEDEEKEEPEQTQKGGLGGNRFDRLEKAIATSHQINSKYIRALGVMVKDASMKLDAAAEREQELMSIVKAQDETISMLSEKLEEYGGAVPAPKSLSHARPVERTFAKAGDAEFEKGGQGQEQPENSFSMSKNPRAVAELLDQATFAKGYDEEFSKACTAFEAVHNLPANIIARMKNEFGVQITK